MPGILHGNAIWPGAISVENATYTCSHGISPGVAILRMSPQPVFPDMFGDLIITDGQDTVTVPGCKLDDLKLDQDSNGVFWSLTIVDTRWRWRDLGAIGGCYNQLDPHGNLYPWSIRSPTELAVLCLQALGVTNYQVNLPPGIDFPGFNIPNPIIGISGTNPPVNWDYTPPAQALQQLADQYGCRVIYQVGADGILITPLGIGGPLPPGSIHKQGPSLKSPETPDSIGVVGAPIRYQGQFALLAVGLEWDDSYRYIDFLSYAPPLPAGGAGQVQISQVTFTYDGTTTGTPMSYVVTLNGVPFTINVAMGDTAATIATRMLLSINLSINPGVQGVMTTAIPLMQPPTGYVITITGVTPGVSFGCVGSLAGTPTSPLTEWPVGNDCVAATTQASAPGLNVINQGLGQVNTVWYDSAPDSFANVVRTPRLTKEEAIALAQKSVFKCYQLVNLDVDGQGGPINVPGYGPLQRRQQVVLTDTQCDQIVPAPGDENILDPDGVPITVNFYNGYSKDKPAVVFGSISSSCFQSSPFTFLQQPVTAPDAQVRIPFTFDAINQVITFSDYVYGPSSDPERKYVSIPKLFLQTAVNIRNAFTNQLERFTQVVPLPGQNSQTMPKFVMHEDIQVEVTSVYNPPGRLIAVSILNADAFQRARYYLNGLAAQYNQSAALIQDYNGIMEIDLDGAIQQVTWSVGPEGATTTASLNTEHHLAVPPYPARRRAEFLPPFPRGQVGINMIQAGVDTGSGGGAGGIQGGVLRAGGGA